VPINELMLLVAYLLGYHTLATEAHPLSCAMIFYFNRSPT
jgi:hypothetical protein